MKLIRITNYVPQRYLKFSFIDFGVAVQFNAFGSEAQLLYIILAKIKRSRACYVASSTYLTKNI